MSYAPLKQVNRKSAAQDISDAIGLYKTWAYLSYQDIISRYRRSILGPFWVAAMMISQAVAMSLVFGGIYKAELKEFLPYVIAGLTIVLFIGSAFGEGAETYLIYGNVVTAHNLPLSFHIFRMCCRQFVIFAHNFAIFLVVYLAFNHTLHINYLIVPGLLLNLLFLFGCTMFTATLGLRFRDFKFILPNVWLIVFYLTPVIWKPSQLGTNVSFVYIFNPIYYMLEVMRGPMLGYAITANIWIGATLTTLAMLLIAYCVFATMRNKIALWI